MSAPPRPRVAPFYLLVAGAYAALTLPRLAQPGMFVDGVTYAVIARNLAEGQGTFWFPFYTSTLLPQFHEHLPLTFTLQGAAFALFGDHLAVERAYAFACGALIALLTVAVWRRTSDRQDLAWLPVVFWLLPSVVTWTIVNNMLETTQTVFTTLSVLAFVTSLQVAGARAVLAACAAGLCVLAAVLAKGPTGLFPLAAPVVAALLLPGHRRAAVRSGAVLYAAAAAGVGLMLLTDGAAAALGTYWDGQVTASIAGTRGRSSPGATMSHLGGGIWLRMGALAAILLIGGRLAGAGRAGGPLRPGMWTWFFFVLALCASLPVAISQRIVGHYFVQSAPVYALAFAGLTASIVARTIDRAGPRSWGVRAARTVGIALLAAAAILPALGWVHERRDADWIAEYRSIGPFLTRHTSVGSCEAAGTRWDLHAYLQRFSGVSIDTERVQRPGQFLHLREEPCDVPPDCGTLVLTPRLALLECG